VQLCGTQAHEVAILVLSGIVCGSITVIFARPQGIFVKDLGGTIFFSDFQ
jgi:hypothetical protein